MDSVSSPLTFVVSDLHLGNEYFSHDSFLSWLDGLPHGAQLVLNGDIVDKPTATLVPEHRNVLERLIEESHERSIVWVYGNHDRELKLDNAGRIHFTNRWEIERRLLIVHGDELDGLMPRHTLFKTAFKLLHRVRIALGLPDVHVAKYAKKWGFFYRVLNEHVAHKALDEAGDLGFEAVTCGHTHASMDLERGGTRYLNTGAWTEEPHYYVTVSEREISLCCYQNGTATTGRG